MALPRPGAGAGPAGGRAQRHLRPRLRPFRGARGPARVPRRHPGRDHGRDPRRRAARSAGSGARRTRRARGPRPPVPREGPRRALAVRRRRGARPAPRRRGDGREPAAARRRAALLPLGARRRAAGPRRGRRCHGACCSRGAPAAAPLRFAVAAPPGVLLSRPTMGTPFAVSPDGRRIVFSGSVGGHSSLWLWSAEDGQSHRLEDTAAASRRSSRPTGGRWPSSRETTFGACRSTADRRPRSRRRSRQLRLVGQRRDHSLRPIRRAGRRAVLPARPRGRGLDDRVGRLVRRAPGLSSLSARRPPLPLSQGFRRSRHRAAAVRRVHRGRRAGLLRQLPLPGRVLGIGARAVRARRDPHRDSVRRPQPQAHGRGVTVARDVRWFGPSGSASFAVSADGRPSSTSRVPRPRASPGSTGSVARRPPSASRRPSARLQLSPDGRRVVVDVCSPTAAAATSGPSTRAPASPPA